MEVFFRVLVIPQTVLTRPKESLDMLLLNALHSTCPYRSFLNLNPSPLKLATHTYSLYRKLETISHLTRKENY